MLHVPETPPQAVRTETRDTRVNAASTTAANSIRCTTNRREAVSNAPDEEEQCKDARAQDTTKGPQTANKQSATAGIAAAATSNATGVTSHDENQSCNEAAHQAANRSQTAYEPCSASQTFAATVTTKTDDE